MGLHHQGITLMAIMEGEGMGMSQETTDMVVKELVPIMGMSLEAMDMAVEENLVPSMRMSQEAMDMEGEGLVLIMGMSPEAMEEGLIPAMAVSPHQNEV